MSPLFALVCRNCARSMPLPLAKHPGKFRGQWQWPNDGKPRNFACPACKHVYEYSAPDPRSRLLEELAQDQPRLLGSTVCAEISCGQPNCESQVRVLLFVEFDASPHIEARAMAAKWILHVKCGNGHDVSEVDSRTPTGAYFDGDWDRG